MKFAEKAVSIDDELAEAHASLAYTCMLYGWDWQRAEHEFKKSLQINPSYAQAHLWYSQYLAGMGRFDEAIAEGRRAQELDPINLSINANVGLVLYWAREYTQAEEQLRKTLELDPNFGLAHYYLAYPLAASGRYDEAISALRKSIEITGGMPMAFLTLAYTYGRAGRSAEAKKVLQELKALCQELDISSSMLGFVYAGLGDREKGLEHLNQCYEDRNPMMVWIKILPELDGVRSDPRFQDLLRRLRLYS